MLNIIREKLEEMKENKRLGEIEKLKLIKEICKEDEIGMKTDWEPLKRGGSSHKNFNLKIDEERNILKINETLGSRFLTIFAIVFILGMTVSLIREEASVSVNSYGVGNDSKLVFLIPASMLGILIIGSFFNTKTNRSIFDNNKRIFYKGKYDSKKDRGEKEVILYENIYAIQIISEMIRKEKTYFTSYEVNLVLNDTTRINVLDHSNLSSILKDTKMLSQYLNVPIWDYRNYLG